MSGSMVCPPDCPCECHGVITSQPTAGQGGVRITTNRLEKGCPSCQNQPILADPPLPNRNVPATNNTFCSFIDCCLDITECCIDCCDDKDAGDIGCCGDCGDGGNCGDCGDGGDCGDCGDGGD